MKRRKMLALSSIGALSLVLRTSIAEATPVIAREKTTPLLRFVALGDVGTGNRGQYAIAEAMNGYFQKSPFSLVLLTGDNIYNNGEIAKVGAAFERPYRFLRQRQIPFYAVLGNHDIRTNNGEDQLAYPGYNMQGRYYTFSPAPKLIQFFALDTNKNVDWQQQLVWLDRNLASSQAIWKVVFGHHPVYSSGIHGSTLGLETKLSPLLARYGVQLYLCGHDHNYERTQPIQGTTYIVCGAGASTRPVGSSQWTACSKAKLNFTTFAVYPEQIEIAAIGADGKEFDRSVIE